MTHKLPTLDPLLHQPARTQIVAFLSGRGQASFSDLKHALDVTDGNLGAHLAKLVEAGLVKAGEGMVSGRAQTLFQLTPAGRSALAQYVARLTSLMKIGAPQGTRTARPLVHRTKPRTP